MICWIVNSWLTGACTQACTAAEISNASAIINQGCASDLASGSAVAVSRVFIFIHAF